MTEVDIQHELLVTTKLYSLKDAEAVLDGYEKMHKLRKPGCPSFLFIQFTDDNKFTAGFTGSQVHIECDTLEEAIALGYGAAIQKRCSDENKRNEAKA